MQDCAASDEVEQQGRAPTCALDEGDHGVLPESSAPCCRSRVLRRLCQPLLSTASACAKSDVHILPCLSADAAHIGTSCASGGACKWSDDCAAGTQLTGECPGSSSVKCCVPNTPDHLASGNDVGAHPAVRVSGRQFWCGNSSLSDKLLPQQVSTYL